MANVTELKVGNYIKEDGGVFYVLDKTLNKTAMRKMVVTLKLKNLRTGSVTEISRNSGYDIEVFRIEKRQMQYLYDSGDFLVFMDQENYDQIEIPKETLQRELKFLKGDEIVEIVSYEGEILGVSLPPKVALKITSCEAAIRGDTVNRATKEATLETGLTVRVPLFIEEGEVVLVRTDNGEFDGRA